MYTLACRVGLSCAIANPSAISLCDDEEAFDVLLGRDKNCEHWIKVNQQVTPAVITPENPADDISSLRLSINRGLKDDAKKIASQLLNSSYEALSVIQDGIVPALEEVGSNFESGKIFLPQLLMSADAAGAAFESVKSTMRASSAVPAAKGKPIVIATVKGDIHDIGKNIVRTLLENYGFDVIDLGRDVAPEKIVEAAKKTNAMMVGLSALMTTTVGAMAETISLLRKEKLSCKICVGGAVVTQDYADEIGADFYGKDAMCTVRFAEELAQKISP
jgi:5-methyltetrahydrofolate--homocysteine methyltransferase